MRLPTITLFFSILITNYNLKSMEEKAQQKQLTHYFSDADTSAQKNYSIILSFYEAIFSGCKFKVDAPQGKIMFNNLFSSTTYKSSVKKVIDVADSTECPNSMIFCIIQYIRLNMKTPIKRSKKCPNLNN